MYRRCFGRKIHICITHKQLKIRYIITNRSSFMLCMRCQVFLSVKTCLKGQGALVRMFRRFISPKVHQLEEPLNRRFSLVRKYSRTDINASLILFVCFKIPLNTSASNPIFPETFVFEIYFDEK